MGKVLIATFDDEDEMALDELLLFLKSKKYIRFINTFSNDNYLKYDNLVIDLKYRIVETGGESIELNSHARLACYTMNKTGVASGSFS